MRIGVLAATAGWLFDDLRRAAGGRHEIVWLDYAQLSDSIGSAPSERGPRAQGTRLAELDALLVRSMPAGSLEAVVFRMDLLGRSEADGLLVVNSPKAMEIAVDKYLTTARLAAAGLCVPRTIVCQTVAAAMEAFHSLGGDVVLKPLFGGEGRGIARLTDEAIAERTFGLLASLGAVFYLQEFVAHAGRDLRVLVIGDDAWAIERTNPLDWRTNVSRGAAARRIEPTAEMLSLAHRAAQTVGAEIAGVDLLPDADGRLYAIEVNAAPGSRATAAAIEVDIAAAIIRHLAQIKGVRTH